MVCLHLVALDFSLITFLQIVEITHIFEKTGNIFFVTLFDVLNVFVELTIKYISVMSPHQDLMRWIDKWLVDSNTVVLEHFHSDTEHVNLINNILVLISRDIVLV